MTPIEQIKEARSCITHVTRYDDTELCPMARGWLEDAGRRLDIALTALETEPARDKALADEIERRIARLLEKAKVI